MADSNPYEPPHALLDHPQLKLSRTDKVPRRWDILGASFGMLLGAACYLLEIGIKRFLLRPAEYELVYIFSPGSAMFLALTLAGSLIGAMCGRSLDRRLARGAVYQASEATDVE